MAEKPRKEKEKKKRSRKRNVRLEVESSSSSSSSSSDSESDAPIEHEKAAPKQSGSDVEIADQSSVDEQPAFQQPRKFSEAEFTAWYMQQVTKELSDDLDKIRSASDFKDSSLPILISALQQGTALFSQEEKQRILSTKS